MRGKQGDHYGSGADGAFPTDKSLEWLISAKWHCKRLVFLRKQAFPFSKTTYRDDVGMIHRHSIFSPPGPFLRFVKTALFCCPNAFHGETDYGIIHSHPLSYRLLNIWRKSFSPSFLYLLDIQRLFAFALLIKFDINVSKCVF